MEDELIRRLDRLEKKLDTFLDRVSDNRTEIAVNRTQITECRHDHLADLERIYALEIKAEAHARKFAWLAGAGALAGGAAGWLGRLFAP